MTEKEKRIFKKELRKYLLSVLAEEEYYTDLATCRAEAIRVGGWNPKFRNRVASCCSDWLRGLPIGVEFATWKICVKICEILGWKYDPLFSLGSMKIKAGGRVRTYDTFDLDTIYWDTLGEIIAEEE